VVVGGNAKKGLDMYRRGREGWIRGHTVSKRVCVCVCEREREREKEIK